MNIFDKLHELKDALDGESTKEREERLRREAEEERLRVEKEREEAKENVEADRGWTGKVQDIFDGGKHKKELEEAEFQRLEHQAQAEKKKHDSLGGKIRSALDDSTDELQKVHASGKVQQLWSNAPAGEKKAQEKNKAVRENEGKAPAGGKKGDEGWRDQLRALAGGQHQAEKKKVERSWLKEKLNTMAGGGAAGEADEDKLDKAVDFVQEYVLKQGDQSDESALENLKDEQISDAIRFAYKRTFGHALPLKDK